MRAVLRKKVQERMDIRKIGKRCYDKVYNWQIRKRMNAIGALLGIYRIKKSSQILAAFLTF
jgi:hypothetical protein